MIIFLVLIPVLAAALFFLLPAKKTRLIEMGVIVAAMVELVLAFRLVARVVAEETVRSAGVFAVDGLSVYLILIIALVGFFVSLYSVGYLRAEVTKGIIGPRRVRQFFILLEIFLFAMYLAVSTVHPVITWTAVEATTLATAFLISFYNKPSATEAAWKYLILNSLGLLIGLLGTLLFLALSDDHSGATDWASLASAAGSMTPDAAKIAFVLILVGYGTKVGLAPLHAWLPDAHSKAPSPISALLSGVLLNVALFSVLRWKHITDLALGDTHFTGGLLIFFGTLSVVLAAFIIFVQKNYKRLLAYSSIEHMGLMTIGFGLGGVGTMAGLLHMFYHAIAKSMLFLLAGNIFLRFSSTKLKNVSGLFKALPLTGPLFFAGILMLAGLPPFALFVTKLLILSAGITFSPWLVGVLLLALSVIFFGFFRILSALVYGPVPEGTERGESNRLTQLPVVLMFALLLVLSWQLPDPLPALLQMITQNFSL
ncbi:MAG: proton-conducting transporter membrane subunit [Candidatus Moraniibacteriota bacterium]